MTSALRFHWFLLFFMFCHVMLINQTRTSDKGFIRKFYKQKPTCHKKTKLQKKKNYIAALEGFQKWPLGFP